MSTSKKGFDPLASLFDLPESAQPPAAPPAPPARGDDLPEPPHVKPTPPMVPPMAGPDPAQLAKILAKAAQAKAGAPKPAPGATIVPPVAKPAPKPAPPAAPASRLMGAPPPKKTLSAEDAMRFAAEEEVKAKAAAAAQAAAPKPAAATPAPAPATPAAAPAVPAGALADVVSGIIQDGLPELGPVYVAKALSMDDRGVLTALWRAHRARFASTGDVAGAVAVSTVLRALARVGPGQLAVAHAVTDKTDWLVWVDLSQSTLIAAFKDARAWFGGS